MNISLEFFPPANLDFNALLSEYKKLEHLDPSFVSVTYGAGGGAENKSLELIKALKKNNLDIAAHITLVNKSIDDLEKIVSDFAKLGVKKFVALRGDSPEGKFKQHPNGFFNTSDFVEFLNNKNFEVIVSAYPEPHPDSKGFDFDLQNTDGTGTYGNDLIEFTSTPGTGGSLNITGSNQDLKIDTSFSDDKFVINNLSYYLGQTFTNGVSNPEVKKYSGDLVYVDNRPSITRSENQREDIKIVLQF